MMGDLRGPIFGLCVLGGATYHHMPPLLLSLWRLARGMFKQNARPLLTFFSGRLRFTLVSWCVNALRVESD